MPKRLTTEEFINRAKEIHGNKYSYDLVEYKNNKTKVKIICSKHGIFEQQPHGHLKGYGCARCNNGSIPLTTEEFINRAKEIHGNKYSYDLVEYKNNRTKVKILCPEHGEFEQTPQIHLNGSGCIKCTSRYTKTIEENENLDFSKYKNNKTICPNCVNNKDYSIAEKEINLLINELGFKTEENVKNIISPYELDIYIPSKKLAIEYNRLYWHSEQQTGDRRSHLKKLEKCNLKGIRLITIFEDEWIFKRNIVENRLKHILGISSKIIGGRSIIIKEIPANIKNQFLEEQHIQGIDRASIKLGGYYKNELISVMTFCVPRVSLGRKEKKEGEWELSRFALKFGISGPGIASKMFKYFIKNYNVNEIYTFSDRRWNTGQLYLNLGMEFVYYTDPNYFYILNGHREHRFKYRKQQLPKLLESFDPNLTEYENMLMNGIDRIWDCGNVKYLKKLT